MMRAPPFHVRTADGLRMREVFDDVLQLPTGALFRRGNAWMAFAIEEGRARLREVKIGQNNGIAAQVRAGLTEGQIVIVYPPDHLTDGDRVAAGSES